MDQKSEDISRLWAAVAIARNAAGPASATNTTDPDALEFALRILRGLPWQLNASLNFKPTVRMWIDKPIFCYRLRRLAHSMNEDPNGPGTNEKLEKLTRTLALIEFGVEVNEKWYRLLEGMVADRVVAISELRKLLGCIEISTDWNGELTFSRFHLATRLLIGAFFIFCSSMSLILLAAAIQQIWLHGFFSTSVWYFAIYSSLPSMFSWGAWWLGPHSWLSSKKLCSLLASNGKPQSMGILSRSL